MTRDEVEEIFGRYGPMVLRRARSILGNEEEAKDMMQEVFIKALFEPTRFEAPEQVSSWLYRVTTNACLNQLRNSGRRGALVRQHLSSEEPEAPSSDNSLLARQLLAEADENWSAAAVLVHVDGLSYEEASKVLGVSTRTVSNFLTRFRTYALGRLGEVEA